MLFLSTAKALNCREAAAGTQSPATLRFERHSNEKQFKQMMTKYVAQAQLLHGAFLGLKKNTSIHKVIEISNSPLGKNHVASHL